MNIKILEILLHNTIEEQKQGTILWLNFSEVAHQAGVAKSSGKRILDELIAKEFVLEKEYETHAQNPPRMVRMNNSNGAINELIFFFKKVRGFL